MNKTAGLLLAGGVGSRLGVLASLRTKPAVPFGGIYRIIDFALSNAANSGIDHLGILTQYKPLSLMDHIGVGKDWGYGSRLRSLKILPPRTGEKDSDWYKGTADAVRQNMEYVTQNPDCDTLVILSGDHIYQMDYREIVAFHKARGAKLTLATREVAIEDAHHFGIAKVNSENKIVEWAEKPRKPKSTLASMGIYVFSIDFIKEAFREIKGTDFGMDIIPWACELGHAYAFPFSGYWRDVGTLKSYWSANIDLLDANSGLHLEDWKIYTNSRDDTRLGDRPPSFVGRDCEVKNSVVSQGCEINGCIENSIISPGVTVQHGASIKNSIIMDACTIGADAQLDRVILDKNVTIGDGVSIGEGTDDVLNREYPDFLESGISIVGKGSHVPGKCRIGKHCIIKPFTPTSSFQSNTIEGGETVGAVPHEYST